MGLEHFASERDTTHSENEVPVVNESKVFSYCSSFTGFLLIQSRLLGIFTTFSEKINFTLVRNHAHFTLCYCDSASYLGYMWP